MSLDAITHVWKNSKQEGGNLLVMLALADYADDQGCSYPATATLARKARLSDRQVQRVTKKLEEEGEILVHKNKGRNGSNLYQIVGLSWGDKMSGVTKCRGDAGVAEGVTPTSPKPPVEPSKDKGESKKLPTSFPAIRIAKLFNRRLTTEWTDKEIRAFKRISFRTEEDLEDLQLVYAYTEAQREIGGIHRRDLLTFLNNYAGELDRARAWKLNPTHHNVRNGSSHPKTPSPSPGNAGTANAAVAGQY